MSFSRIPPVLRVILLIMFLFILILSIFIWRGGLQREKFQAEFESTATKQSSTIIEQGGEILELAEILSRTPTLTPTSTSTPTLTPTNIPTPTNTPTFTPIPTIPPPTPLPLNICESLVSTLPDSTQACRIQLLSVGLPLEYEVKVNLPILQTWRLSNPDGCTVGEVLNRVNLDSENNGLQTFDSYSVQEFSVPHLSFAISIPAQKIPGKYYGCWQIQGTSYSDLLPIVIDVVP